MIQGTWTPFVYLIVFHFLPYGIEGGILHASYRSESVEYAVKGTN